MEKVKYINLIHQPKKFLEGGWEELLKSYILKYKDIGIKEVRFIIHKDNNEDFVNLMGKLGFKPKFLGFSEKPIKEDEMIPTDEGIYTIQF